MGDELTAGKIVDNRYVIIEHISDGGMGRLFKAREIELDRTIALKLLHPALVADREARARFLREAAVMTQLPHKNIVVLYRFGFWQSLYPYLAMEFLEGADLRTVLSLEGRLSVDRCLNIGVQICDALEAAHSRGIIHRDLKPDNIILQDEPHTDFVKVLDFGLARSLQSAASSVVQHLTHTGLLIGSVHYMSPEQCQGKKADQRSDIYSLGCLLYECITGNRAVEADTPVGLLHKHCTEWPARFSEQQCIDDVRFAQMEPILFKAMNKEPAGRYQTMKEMRADLDHIRQGHDVSAKMPNLDLTVPRNRNRPRVWLACLIVMPVIVIAFALWKHGGTGDVVLINEPGSAKNLRARSINVNAQKGDVGKLVLEKNPAALETLREMERTIRRGVSEQKVSNGDVLRVCVALADLSSATAPGEAIGYLDRGIEILQDRSDRERLLLAKYKKAEILMTHGSVIPAEKLLTEALSGHQDSDESDPMIAPIYNTLATCLRIERRDHEAEQLYLRIAKRCKDRLVQLMVLSSLGDFYLEQHRYSDAKRTYLQCLQLSSASGAGRGSLLGQLALVSGGLSLHSEAESYYEQGQQLCTPNTDACMRLVIHYLRFLVETGHRDRARKTLLTWFDRNSNLSLQVRLVANLSSDEPGAIEAFESVRRRLDSEGPSAVTSDDLLSFCLATSKWPTIKDPLPLLDRCINVLSSRSDHHNLALVNFQKGKLMVAANKFAEAEPLLRQVSAEVVATEGVYQFDHKVELYRDLARCCWVGGKPADAETFFIKAIDSCGANVAECDWLNETLGDFYLEHLRGDKAADRYRKCVPPANESRHVRVLLKIADGCGMSRRFSEALSAIQQARKACKSGDLQEGYKVDIAEFRLLAQTGNVKKARLDFEAWIKVHPDVFWAVKSDGLTILRKYCFIAGDRAAGLHYLQREIDITRENLGRDCALAEDLESLKNVLQQNAL